MLMLMVAKWANQRPCDAKLPEATMSTEYSGQSTDQRNQISEERNPIGDEKGTDGQDARQNNPPMMVSEILYRSPLVEKNPIHGCAYCL